MERRGRRIMMAMIGVFFTGVSVAMFQLAALGTDPFTCACLGIAGLFGATYGVVFTVCSALLFCVVFRYGRRHIGMATLFNLFGTGSIVDFCFAWMSPWLTPAGLWEQIALMLAAVFVLCFSASLYYTAELGVSVYDAAALMLAERSAAPFRFCRVGTDAGNVAVGFLLGATVGIGTVVTACFMGPMIDYFNRSFSQPLLQRGMARFLHFT